MQYCPLRSAIRRVATFAMGLAALSGQSGAAPAPARAEQPISALPYSPSLDPQDMDTSIDPCTDFYGYVCGGWQKHNPIPADQAQWSVYGKLADDNQRLLWGLLLGSAEARPDRSPAEQKIGDYFHACMDEPAIEAAGLQPIRPLFATVDGMQTLADLPAALAKLQLGMHDYDRLLFGWTSAQDFGKAEDVIGSLEASGLGLPDRDYYVKTDAKSIATRRLYQQHITKMLTLAGEAPAVATAHAARILALETALAKATLTRVERRDPYKLYHKLNAKQLAALMPSFAWPTFFTASGTADLQGNAVVNVAEPKFFQTVDAQLRKTDLDTWKAYLRWHLLHSNAPYLTKAVSDEDFAFFRHHLRGVEAQKPRWKRCVTDVDRDLGEALGQVFVAKTFTPELKSRTVAMTKEIEDAMHREIDALPWMAPATKQNAVAKLQTLVNKVGYPDRWRDYAALDIKADDFFGNAQRAAIFEAQRLLAKIGKPLDRTEWMMTPPTVNAYYDPQMNDMNFPAGVLQPPLYDAKLDDAPNYGNTGSTIGHELTHAFDDQGKQYDAKGNLRDWWSKKDTKAFEQRAACIVHQYGQYEIVDGIKINSKMTLGEDIADLGGTLIALEAWRHATAGQKLQPIDGLSPEQRFFIGLGQWACENERPENLRANAATNAHSPGRYRINGVVANMPEFAAAFQCKAGQPMVRRQPCKIW